MAIRRVKLTFPPDLIREPIIYQLGRRFPVVTNIRRADVTATYGWVVLELEGAEDDLRQALDWAAEVGVRVDPVEGDPVPRYHEGERRMAIVVKIPAPLRRLTDGQREVQTEAGTVAECIEQLGQTYPGLKDRLCEDDGSIRRFINIYVRGEDIRFGNGLATALRDGDDVSIIPAASGG